MEQEPSQLCSEEDLEVNQLQTNASRYGPAQDTLA